MVSKKQAKELWDRLFPLERGDRVVIQYPDYPDPSHGEKGTITDIFPLGNAFPVVKVDHFGVKFDNGQYRYYPRKHLKRI